MMTKNHSRKPTLAKGRYSNKPTKDLKELGIL